MQIFISYRTDSTVTKGIEDRLNIAFGDQSAFRGHQGIAVEVDFRTALETEDIEIFLAIPAMTDFRIIPDW